MTLREAKSMVMQYYPWVTTYKARMQRYACCEFVVLDNQEQLYYGADNIEDARRYVKRWAKYYGKELTIYSQFY